MSTLPSSCIGVTSATMLPMMGFMKDSSRGRDFSQPTRPALTARYRG
jgi:hypothetical protein